MCVGFLSAADGCSAASMCCLYAGSTDALLQVQCSATKAELSWHSQYVWSSDITTSIGVTDVTASVATDVRSAEVACDEPASNACKSFSHLDFHFCHTPIYVELCQVNTVILGLFYLHMSITLGIMLK